MPMNLETLATSIADRLLQRQENGNTSIENLMSGYKHHPKTVRQETIKIILQQIEAALPASADIILCR